MLLADLQNDSVLERLPTVDGISLSDVGELSGFLRVGEWVALPVNQVACRIDGSSDPEICDEGGASIGTLCLTEKLAGVSPAALTTWQYVAYLADVEASSAGASHVFKLDYVILKSDLVPDYIEKYLKSAPIWGGFSHKPVSDAVSREYDVMVARAGMKFPTRFHDMALSRYVSASNAFDRFLRLYHSIELIFDFIIMKSIQKLDDDMVGFGSISKSYGKSELDRLKYLFSEYCYDWAEIAGKFSAVSQFSERAEEIFQDHTKDGNPLSSKWEKFLTQCIADQVSSADFLASRICDNGNNSYEKIVPYVAAYWIYRVRSSIAHTRVSEFLFEESDEEFIVDFAEPLLLEVVRQIFSSPRLEALVG